MDEHGIQESGQGLPLSGKARSCPTCWTATRPSSSVAIADVNCWNACCSNIDIPLTPYDILRLKNRLDMSSGEFLQQYTVPYEMDKDGMAGVKFKPVEGGTACQFMMPEGCSVYEDRPTACRYYPVALLSMRTQDEYTDRTVLCPGEGSALPGPQGRRAR